MDKRNKYYQSHRNTLQRNLFAFSVRMANIIMNSLSYTIINRPVMIQDSRGKDQSTCNNFHANFIYEENDVCCISTVDLLC